VISLKAAVVTTGGTGLSFLQELIKRINTISAPIPTILLICYQVKIDFQYKVV
jgi:hypothetical protein